MGKATPICLGLLAKPDIANRAVFASCSGGEKVQVDDELLVRQVLSGYSIAPTACQIESRGTAGGFSGAQFWMISTQPDSLCLRRWPKEHPDRRRLQFIHDVLKHVADSGLSVLPVPLVTGHGATIVELDGSLWELSRWMPGRADYHSNPNERRLLSALQTLAEFHVRVRHFCSPSSSECQAPGIKTRCEQLQRLFGGELEVISSRVRRGGWPELETLARTLIELVRGCAFHAMTVLHRAAGLVIIPQICIRDIWHDHVLFEGDKVSGLVDFGAMRIDCVSGDIARLLGSFVADDPLQWQSGIDAYHAIRPVSPSERELIVAYDVGNMLLSGMNWLRWIYLESRHFDDRQTIEQRLRKLIVRLKSFRARSG